jgi:hypothetical protein
VDQYGINTTEELSHGDLFSALEYSLPSISILQAAGLLFLSAWVKILKQFIYKKHPHADILASKHQTR